MAQFVESTGKPLPHYYQSPRDLQKLASFQVATQLWRRKVHDEAPDMALSQDVCLEWWSDICNCLPLPKPIVDKIYESVEQLNHNCTSFAARMGWSLSDYRLKRKEIVDCVEIANEQKTIRNVLDSDKFNVAEKYSIACQCCFVEDIKKLWDSVSANGEITGIEYGYRREWIYYWNRLMMGLPADQIQGDANYSVELRLLFGTSGVLLICSVVEYLWSKFNSEERLMAVNELLRRMHAAELAKFLPKLNRIETNGVLEIAADYVLARMGAQVEYFDYVLQLWAYYCDFASESEENVYKILRQISFNVYNCFFQLTKSGRFQLSWVLGQLWHHTPSKVKEFVNGGHRVELFFSDLMFYPRSPEMSEVSNCDTSFLLELLKCVNLTRRNQIWVENWPKIYMRINDLDSDVDRFQKLCFRNDEDIKEFEGRARLTYIEIPLNDSSSAESHDSDSSSSLLPAPTDYTFALKFLRCGALLINIAEALLWILLILYGIYRIVGLL